MQRNVFVLLMALCIACPLWAAPAGWVRDGAGVLSTKKQARLETLLEKVKQQTSAEVMVITVPSLNGQDVDSFATTMFNQIGIGDRTRNNGLLFLIAPNERRTRIEVGYGLEPFITDDFAGRILDSYVMPHFRSGNMEAGIVAGAEAIVQALKDNPQAARGIPDSAPQYIDIPTEDLKSGFLVVGVLSVLQFLLYFVIRYSKHYSTVLMFLVGMLSLGATSVMGIVIFPMLKIDAIYTASLYRAIGFGVALLAALSFGAVMIYLLTRLIGGMFMGVVAVMCIAIFAGFNREEPVTLFLLGSLVAVTILAGSLLLNVRIYQRYRTRSCVHCSGPLQLLSETQDDLHLNDAQKQEEAIGSVDCDVWHCPACLHSETARYEKSSLYSDCPECNSRTLTRSETLLEAATDDSEGKKRIDMKCLHCNHADSYIVSTPKRVTPRNSGRSSFSGGAWRPSSSSYRSSSSSGGGSSGGGGSSRSW